MSDTLQRFPCTNCGRILKTRPEWAGRTANCPNCDHKFTVPDADPAPVSARTQHQLEVLIGADDALPLEDTAAEDLALYLSQATCRDFDLAHKLLERRSLPARQWRRILASAAAQENLRLKIDGALNAADPLPDDATPIPLLAAEDSTSANAWTILARHIYFLSHATCEPCRADPTGMGCIYLSYGGFLQARQITPQRASGWHAAIRQHLGI